MAYRVLDFVRRVPRDQSGVRDVGFWRGATLEYAPPHEQIRGVRGRESGHLQ